MRVKIFKGRTIQEAMAAIKEELGPDAMILSTRRVPKSPRDPYAKEMFEIEAAPKADPKEDVAASPKGYVLETKQDEELAPLKDELASIKDLISFVGLESGLDSLMSDHSEAAGLFASLLRSGISEKKAKTILKNASAAMDSDSDQGAGSISIFKKYVIQACLKEIETVDPFAEGPDGMGQPHAAAFVGPTGVGKTTTIAKLAAELKFKRKKSVGLISIDSYRMGAFEQLKSYAAIMGIMCVPAFSRDDLVKALERMRNMDIVLIDTAGHSHSDTARMEEVAQVLDADFKVSVHLVLSMTTGFIDMKTAASAFSALNPESYVFTKIDETGRCGKILDQVGDLKMPISLVTNGQRVPEDLIVPKPQDLLGLMLGRDQG
ncbi:MAG: flagellar biosynthesis protein FlhF [Desulfobacteraceae bacterium]|nr:flagellar biosynthesis protein FlhF [Desulfobacteraceae bacterium]